MHTRNTVIMAVVLLGLAAFVYFTEIRGRDEREQAEQDAQLLVQFEPEEVTGVEIVTAEGTVVAERADGTWQITSPQRIDTDSAAFDRLVDDLHVARQERLVAEDNPDLAAFGLQEPAVRVTLTLGEGRTLDVALGKDTPIGINLYAGVDGSKVYSAPRALRANLDKKLLDLRDRTVVSFEQDQVRRLQLESGSLVADIRREDDDGDEPRWTASAPFSGRADADTIDEVLSSLSTSEAEAFVFEGAPDEEARARFALDAPRASLTLWTADDTSLKLIIGGESTEPAGFYATREGGSSVFVVPADLLDDLPDDADDLRNKQVLAVARDRIRAIEVSHDDVEARVERNGADWNMTGPRALAADASAVSGLLSALQDLRAERFGTQLGARALRVGLSVGDESGPTETLELQVGELVAAPAAAEGEAEAAPATRPVTVTGDDTVYLVPDPDLEALFTDAFALRAKTLVEFDNAAVQQLTLHDGSGTSWALRREGDEWAREDGGEFDGSKATDLLWDLNYLRMEQVGVEWDAEAPDLSAYGLQAPRYRIVATGADGQIADVHIGAEAPADEGSQRVWVRVEGTPGAFAVTSRLLEAVDALAEALRQAP